jgi:hypothetical protein
MFEGGCPVASIVIKSDFFTRELCEEVSEFWTRFYNSRAMEAGLLQNSFVLDLLREFECCFIPDYSEVIYWWVEIKL